MGVAIHTSEIYDDLAGSFTPGLNLLNDVGRSHACLAHMNRNSFFIVGGQTGGGLDRAMIRHDIDSAVWTDLPKPSVARSEIACGHLNGNILLLCINPFSSFTYQTIPFS